MFIDVAILSSLDCKIKATVGDPERSSEAKLLRYCLKEKGGDLDIA